MKSIPVIGNIEGKHVYIQTLIVLLQVANKVLYSLIPAFNSNDFGGDTLYKTLRQISAFNRDLVKPHNAELYIDSGGYSFIRGRIPVLDIVKLIECYNKALEESWRDLSYIFSLDLPWSLKYSKFNTMENVYFYNRLSLMKSFAVIEKQPEIANKFFNIWQFGKRGQYLVFKIEINRDNTFKVDRNKREASPSQFFSCFQLADFS